MSIVGGVNRVAMASVRIKRSNTGWQGPRIAFGLAMLALPIICIQPLIAARAPAIAPPTRISVVLDAPKPFDAAIDPIGLLAPSVAGAALIDPIAVPALFVPPAASSFSPGAAATPYVFRGRNATDTLRASLCLTSAIYYEAANEPDDGQRAVAQVVLNRVRHPAWPSTVCDVVYQGTERPGTLCQFTFGCDGAMAHTPSLAGWVRARRVAQAALAGYVFAPAGLATNYHTLAVAPSWGPKLTPVGIIGAHIFYRLPGGAGEPKAFFASYRGHEPIPGPRAKIASPLDSLIFAAAGAAALPVFDPGVVLSEPSVAQVVQAKPVAADRRYVSGALPESDVREEYRASGEWITR